MVKKRRWCWNGSSRRGRSTFFFLELVRAQQRFLLFLSFLFPLKPSSPWSLCAGIPLIKKSSEHRKEIQKWKTQNARVRLPSKGLLHLYFLVRMLLASNNAPAIPPLYCNVHFHTLTSRRSEAGSLALVCCFVLRCEVILVIGGLRFAFEVVAINDNRLPFAKLGREPRGHFVAHPV